MWPMNRGRPKLEEGKARTEMIKARVRPAAAEKFRAEAQRRGIKEADAVRQALAMWMANQGRLGT